MLVVNVIMVRWRSVVRVIDDYGHVRVLVVMEMVRVTMVMRES